MPRAMKIPDAKAAVDEEGKKLETTPAWQLEKVKSKKEVNRGGRTKATKIRRTSRAPVTL